MSQIISTHFGYLMSAALIWVILYRSGGDGMAGEELGAGADGLHARHLGRGLEAETFALGLYGLGWVGCVGLG